MKAIKPKNIILRIEYEKAHNGHPAMTANKNATRGYLAFLEAVAVETFAKKKRVKNLVNELKKVRGK